MSETTAHDTSAVEAEAARANGRGYRTAAEFVAVVVLITLLAVAFALAAILPAFAATKATVSARSETGFARLVFDFEDIPGYTDEVASGVLILSFDKQVSIDMSEVPERIPDYIGIAKRDPDGRAFRLAMQRAFRVNIMEAGNKLFVDLLPPSWIGVPPSLPKHVMRELSLRALEAERKAKNAAQQKQDASDPYKLNVTMGKLPTFTRLVFAWNKFVTADLGRRGSQVSLEFGRNAKVDLSRLKVDPPKYLRGAAAKQTETGMKIELTVDGDVDVRGFREGNSYVLDLTGPNDVAAVAAAKAARAIPRAGTAKTGEGAAGAQGGEEEIKLAGSGAEPGSPVPESAPASDVQTKLKSLQSETLQDQEFADGGQPLPPGPVSQAETAPQADKPEASDEARASASRANVALGADDPAAVAQGQAPKAEPVGDDAIDPSAETAADSGTDTAAEDQAAPKAETPASETVKTADARQARNAQTEALLSGEAVKPKISARMETTPSQIRLTFPFPVPVASSVFRRGNHIWLVFDSDADIDISAIDAAKGKRITEVERVVAGPMQYVRIHLARPWLTYVEAKKEDWIVTIGDMVTGTMEPLNLQRVLREDKRSMIKVALKSPGRVHWLEDPEVGDRLATVTALGPAQGVAKPQDFVDFSALTSAHGLVIRPNADDVGVRLTIDEVVITRHDGLIVSAGGAHQYVPGRKPLETTIRHGYIDFRAWRVKDPEQLSIRVAQMQRSIALSPDEEKSGLRFALARLFIANDLTSEALGILNQMAIDDQAVAMDPSFNAMRGAALVLLGRTAEARKELGVHALANDQDAGLWRALLEAKEKNWDAAINGFYRAWSAADAYPDTIQARFWLAAARAGLEAAQLEKAADALEALPDRELPALLEAQASLLRGRYLANIGRYEEAMEAFDAALKGPHRASAAEAELNIIIADMKAAKIANEAAIDKLERLQIVWRGDDIELGAMRLLADLYVNEKRYADAFSIMEGAVRSFPKADIARKIQDDMRLVFQDLFLYGKSDELPPIDALSLFYDNRELTPAGRLGDDMIRKLAERLISVDLLDQASDILGHQVEKRLSGAARAQVATRLAMVHLLNRKPGLAIRALRRTRQSGLPEALLRQRSLLEARALGELGRAEAAIEILNTLSGDDIERMKGDALWTSQQWQKAGEQLERYLGLRWQNPKPLNERERKDVLRAGISYALSNDQFALDRLRKKFYDKMMTTGEAESFLLVTKPTKMQGADIRQLAKEIAGTDTLDAFMKEFRESFEAKTGAQSLTDQPAPATAG